MNWICHVCGEHGTGYDLEHALMWHQTRSPECPVNLRPFVIASGTHVEFTVNAFLPLTTEIKERV